MTVPAWAGLVVAYLLGSLPSAYLLVRIAGRGDVRRIGSGNVGATNALRAAGLPVALAVLLLDLGKGVAAVLLMRLVTGNPAWAAAAAFAAIVGHCFPVWLRFSGGKGVATLIGAYALIAPGALAAAAGVWVAVFAATRTVAAGSLAAAAALPVALHVIGAPRPEVLGCTAAAALVVIWRHRENLARLVRGEEPRIGGRDR
ncbi:MAG: glycerol-3-phosphate 1-O-acyltransferase PlsY [Acidobacteriota bacterium]